MSSTKPIVQPDIKNSKLDYAYIYLFKFNHLWSETKMNYKIKEFTNR